MYIHIGEHSVEGWRKIKQIVILIADPLTHFFYFCFAFCSRVSSLLVSGFGCECCWGYSVSFADVCLSFWWTEDKVEGDGGAWVGYYVVLCYWCWLVLADSYSRSRRRQLVRSQGGQFGKQLGKTWLCNGAVFCCRSRVSVILKVLDLNRSWSPWICFTCLGLHLGVRILDLIVNRSMWIGLSSVIVLEMGNMVGFCLYIAIHPSLSVWLDAAGLEYLSTLWGFSDSELSLLRDRFSSLPLILSLTWSNQACSRCSLSLGIVEKGLLSRKETSGLLRRFS